jgi:alkylhydroperoxidase/carboxymuconolactone decarboxylase family protein YurZ
MTSLNERQRKLKDDFTKRLGYWNSDCDRIVASSPAYFEAYLAYIAVPWQRGKLAPKVREFVYITLNASTTHLNESALRLHIANALRHGATEAEILEVIQLISILGIHTMSPSLPIVIEEARAIGQDIDIRQLSSEQIALKERFVAATGYWPDNWDALLKLSPELLAGLGKIGAAAVEKGALDRKVREFILIAVDATVTHLFSPGIRTHVRAALRHGASVEEILEVLEVTSVLGLQSVSFGLPILMEEVARLDKAA